MVELGHAALRVRELERAIDFYQQAVGLKIVGRIAGGRAALLTGGRQHNELLLAAAPSMDAGASPRHPLYHVAWRVGEGLDALRAAKDRLDGIGCPIEGAVDHGVSWSLYLRDPDGNQVELFADNPGVNWRRSSDWIDSPSVPFELAEKGARAWAYLPRVSRRDLNKRFTLTVGFLLAVGSDSFTRPKCPFSTEPV